MPIAAPKFRLTQLVICLSATFAVSSADVARAETAAVLSASRWNAPQSFTEYPGSPSATSGVIRNVSSCLDDGSAGTLRQVVGIAASGDTVDLSGLPLACSTITLTQGEIAIGQSTLVIAGPATRTLTITNSQVGRILHHTGLGVVGVYNLALSNAMVYTTSTPAKGGCIFSAGSVYMTAATVTGCKAVSYASNAVGGAIYAAGAVQMIHSTVIGNAAYIYNAGVANGGGVYALDGLRSNFSTISGNFCSTAPGGVSAGGGAYIRNINPAFGVYLAFSTIDNNEAEFGGGIEFVISAAGFIARSSTISGNKATIAGGIDITSPASTPYFAHFYNTTVAFNSAAQYAGVRAETSVAAFSSIIANNANTSPVPFADLYIQGSGHTLTGQKNLMMASNLGLTGTLTGDPKLTPLANRGGGTRTHGLSLSSPAVDSGGISYFAESVDQRGFARDVGNGVDIGSYERQAGDDELFFGGFD